MHAAGLIRLAHGPAACMNHQFTMASQAWGGDPQLHLPLAQMKYEAFVTPAHYREFQLRSERRVRCGVEVGMERCQGVRAWDRTGDVGWGRISSWNGWRVRALATDMLLTFWVGVHRSESEWVNCMCQDFLVAHWCQQHQLADSRSWCGLDRFFFLLIWTITNTITIFSSFFFFPPHGGDIACMRECCSGRVVVLLCYCSCSEWHLYSDHWWLLAHL